MKIIRQNTFETNSSSSHSIRINSTNTLNTLRVNPETKEISLHREEFGWGEDRHDDSLTKAAYALQSVEEDENKFDTVKEVILSFTGAENIKLIGDGYIDHQSSNCFVQNQPDELTFKEWCKEFIFGNYILIISNDNY